jgi:hypothetical protein
MLRSPRQRSRRGQALSLTDLFILWILSHSFRPTLSSWAELRIGSFLGLQLAGKDSGFTAADSSPAVFPFEGNCCPHNIQTFLYRL